MSELLPAGIQGFVQQLEESCITDDELLIECKRGLGIQEDSTVFDGVLKQKITAVKTFMKRAGVPADVLCSEEAVGVIVMGVGDIWQQQSGEVKFSPAFISMTSQLAY